MQTIINALVRYRDQNLPPGGFLTAVLANDLWSTLGRADHINILRLPAIYLVMDDIVPEHMRGSYEAVDRHLHASTDADEADYDSAVHGESPHA